MKIQSKDHPFVEKTFHAKKAKKGTRMKKHANVVHPVGSYKGHLKKAKAFWNHLDKMDIDQQIDPSIRKKMEKPKPLTPFEQISLENKGMTIVKGYVVFE